MPGKGNPFIPSQKMSARDFEVQHSTDYAPVPVEYHSHDFNEIFFFLSGNVTYIIEGKSYHLRPGDILLTNNRELHKPIIKPGTVYDRYKAWISTEFLDEIKELDDCGADLSRAFDSSARRNYNLLRPGRELLQKLITNLDLLSDPVHYQIYGGELLRKCHMLELLVEINQAYFDTMADIEPDIVYNQKISEIVRYINENLCEPLCLDEIASRFFISKYHLAREFKQHVGFTPHQFIQKKRLITAKLLLRQGSTATEAFSESGFNDYSHFSRAFKEEFGYSPREYRQLIRKDGLPK